MNNEAIGWNSSNGIMISAPAKNRAEGLIISNELMKREQINTNHFAYLNKRRHAIVNFIKLEHS